MTIGKYYFTIEFSGVRSIDKEKGLMCFSFFSKGTHLVANFEESHVTIFGFSFIKRKLVARGRNVLNMLGMRE